MFYVKLGCLYKLEIFAIFGLSWGSEECQQSCRVKKKQKGQYKFTHLTHIYKASQPRGRASGSRAYGRHEIQGVIFKYHLLLTCLGPFTLPTAVIQLVDSLDFYTDNSINIHPLHVS